MKQVPCTLAHERKGLHDHRSELWDREGDRDWAREYGCNHRCSHASITKGRIRIIRRSKQRAGTSLCHQCGHLSSQQSIRNLAKDFDEKFSRLDVLINNAGVNCPKRTLTVDGLETTFAVNVLAPFLLTNLLLAKLKSSAPSRIVNVSSDAARGSKLDFDNLQGEKKYSMFISYGQSKLALNLLTLELARRLVGTGVTVNFLHPGVVRTDIARDINPAGKVIFSIVKLFFASPEKGARTPIYLASSLEVASVSGKYFTNQKEVRASQESYDETVARKLWDRCEELTNQR